MSTIRIKDLALTSSPSDSDVFALDGAGGSRGITLANLSSAVLKSSSSSGLDSDTKTDIANNTAARHTHSNKSVLDSITGIVTTDNLMNPTNQTDLVTYAAFVIAAQMIQDGFPTSLQNPNPLTITVGSNTYTYDGSSPVSVTIEDGSEVSY